MPPPQDLSGFVYQIRGKTNWPAGVNYGGNTEWLPYNKDELMTTDRIEVYPGYSTKVWWARRVRDGAIGMVNMYYVY